MEATGSVGCSLSTLATACEIAAWTPCFSRYGRACGKNIKAQLEGQRTVLLASSGDGRRAG